MSTHRNFARMALATLAALAAGLAGAQFPDHPVTMVASTDSGGTWRATVSSMTPRIMFSIVSAMSLLSSNSLRCW